MSGEPEALGPIVFPVVRDPSSHALTPQRTACQRPPVSNVPPSNQPPEPVPELPADPAPQALLDELLSSRKVVACVGSGGVGKTTMAATLGLRAAMNGQKTLVLTIDPAKRLANSLGLSSLGNVETRIDPAFFAAQGLEPKGELWAMMLDQRRTWDDLVGQYAPDPERRDRILENRFYKQLSTRLAGSLEYSAMEKVYELERSGRFDVIVLDTPPTAHALDFLDAPNRLIDLFSHDIARKLLTPAVSAGKVGMSIVNIGSSYVLKVLSRFTGSEMLTDLAGFFAAFQGMYEGFKERAAAVKALLSGPRTGFVLVTSPNGPTIDEATFFAEALSNNGIALAAAIVNRVHDDARDLGGHREPHELALTLAHARIPNEGHPSLAERLARTLDDLRTMALRDLAEIERMRGSIGQTPVWLVPRFDSDVHDLAGLWQVATRLQRLD